MRQRLVYTVVGHISVRIVNGENIKSFSRLNRSCGINSCNCHRKINIVCVSVISVIPRGIKPPRVVDIISEHKTVTRELTNSCHMSHYFKTEIVIKRRPRGVRRRGNVKACIVYIVKRHAVGCIIYSD